MSFPRYDRYKESGARWLGEVPEHWQVRRLDHSFRHIREKVSDKDFAALSVTKHGIVPQLETAAKTDDGDNRKFVRAGDFVINGRSDRNGSAGISTSDGSVSLINLVLRPIDIEGLFTHFLLRSEPFQQEFYRNGKGIVADLWSTGYDEMRNILLAMPTRDEQQRIAAFLHQETAKIDSLIEEQRRLIELLKEKRQAVISHAVTKGLNHDVPTKATGTEWIGSVPNAWAIRAVKELAKPGRKTFTDGDWVESPFITDHGIRLIQTGNVGIGFYKDQGFRYISEEAFEELGCTEIHVNDVLICRLDGPVGRACLVPDLGVRMITSVDNTILKVNSDIDPRFVVYLTSSQPWLDWIDVLCRVGGGFRVRISRNMLGDLRIPSPPYLEQVRIADHLDQECSAINNLLGQAGSAASLLAERRSALISAAVTGKIDVRNYAPKEAA